jgi:tetratricopeptide (TPR) repeat protein
MSSEDEDNYDEEAEMEKVFKMLDGLDSEDSKMRDEAQARVDQYLIKKQRKIDEEKLQKEGWVDGCKTVKENKNCVNKETIKEKRQRLSNEFKTSGNECFRNEEWGRAVEYYTSAILQWDDNPVLFTNRAQAHIKVENFDSAVEDCKQAIKLKPDSVKAQIHLSRALKGRGEFQAAIDVLEIAEDISSEHTKIIRGYKQEVIADMKEHLISYDKARNIADKNRMPLTEQEREEDSREVDEAKFKIPID